MYCSNCGKKINADDLFCGNCGASVNQNTEALKKFHSIREYVQSHRKFLDTGESEKKHSVEEIANRSIYKAMDDQIRKGWGEKFINKSHSIDDKSEVLKILRDEVEEGRISNSEILEIFDSKEFRDYISVDDIVLAVKDRSKDWEDNSFLQRIINYRDRAAKTGRDFVGRHQEVLEIKQLLDIPFTEAERKSAIDLDINERNKILERLQDFEVYLASDLFVRNEGEKLLEASKIIRDIIDEGFNLCVLQNDRELDQRCFKILSDVEALMKDKYSKALAEGKITAEQFKQHEQLPEIVSIKGFFSWIDLGRPPLTKEGDMQPAWVILATLREPKKQIGIHSATNYLSQIIGTVSLAGLSKIVDRYKAVKERLLRNNKLTEEEGQRVDALIEDGLVQNRKIHEQYPDRP